MNYELGSAAATSRKGCTRHTAISHSRRSLPRTVQNLPDSVTCYENTPALQISNRQQKWQVTTANGGVNCKRLFLANNAFAKSLGVATSRLAAMFTYAGLTPSLPDALSDSLGSDQTGVCCQPTASAAL